MKKRLHSEISKEDNSKITDEFAELKECDTHENESESEEEVDDLDDCAVEGGSDEEITDDNDDESDEGVIESNGSDNEDDADDVKESTSGLSSKVKEENKVDEYENDSSDEEDARNTIGNIPIEWYKEKGHIGYDLEGKKIMKEGEQSDELDELIMKMDDPNYWRQVVDPQTNKKVVLSDEDVKLIRKYLRGRYMVKPTDSDHDFSEPFVREVMTHPVTNQPEHKRSFVPSKWERLKVSQIVNSIKMGWLKVSEKKDSDEEDEDREKEKMPKFHDIWGADTEPQGPKRIHHYIAPPKMALPGHYESYNPPPEYLFTPEEEQQWRDKEPGDRRLNFVPKKYNNLRSVPGYNRFVNERFERCLDLYMCPRQIKMRAKVSMEELLPKLPSPRDLLPFPTIQAMLFRGHTDIVRSISFDPSGQFLASGSDDCKVRFWEVRTGRCVKVFEMEGPVKLVKWNPKKSIVIAAVDRKVFVMSCNLTGSEDDPFEGLENPEIEEKEETIPVKWEVSDNIGNAGTRLVISHPQTVTHLSWQKGGDYFSAVLSEGKSLSVLIHRLSSRTTMKPIEKMKGYPQCVLFHPSKPLLYVATKQSVRSYNLATAKGSKKMFPNCNWISSMSIHPKGENLIVGSYDNRITWFDTEQSTKPYKVLKYHKSSVRQVVFHNTLPLFASCSDDGTTRITHATVYNDLLTQPLIVPVKRLSGHVKTKNLCVLDCQFHPRDPIVATAGADKTIRLYI